MLIFFPLCSCNKFSISRLFSSLLCDENLSNVWKLPVSWLGFRTDRRFRSSFPYRFWYLVFNSISKMDRFYYLWLFLILDCLWNILTSRFEKITNSIWILLNPDCRIESILDFSSRLESLSQKFQIFDLVEILCHNFLFYYF